MPHIIYNKNYNTDEPIVRPKDLIDKYIADGKAHSFFLVLPTGKLVKKYRKYYINQYFNKNKKPVRKPNIFTFENFALYIFKKLRNTEPYFIISDATRLALFEIAANMSDLKFYSNKEAKGISLQLISTLSNLIYGIKQEGITIESIKEDLDKPEELTNPQRLTDIYEIYQNYEKILGNLYFDQAAVNNYIFSHIIGDERDGELFFDSFDEYNDKLSDDIFGGIEMILLSGFSEFRLPEYKLISIFQKIKSQFAVVLDFDNEGPHFSNYDDVNKLLISSKLTSKTIVCDYELLSKNKETPYFQLRKSLFKEIKNKLDFEHDIKVIGFTKKEDEAEFIIKEIKRLLIEENYKPSDICVVSRSSATYSSIFRDLSFLHDLPINISDRFDLKSSPVTTSILSVLDLVRNRFEKEDLLKVLSSNYFDFNTSGNRIDLYNIKLVITELRLIGGFSADPSKSYLEKIQMKIDNLNNSDDEYNEVVKYEKALKDLTQVFAKLKPDELKNSSNSIADFSNYIKNRIIKGLKTKEIIKKSFESYVKNQSKYVYSYNDYLSIEKDAKALEAFIETLDELVSVINNVNKVFANTETHFAIDLKSLSEKLKIALSKKRYQVREKEEFSVNITSIEQIRGIPYKVAFLCGAVEGEFPLSFKSEKLLGKELKDSETKHNRSEKQLFYQFLINAEGDYNFEDKSIYITYPKYKGDSELTRSQFLDELETLVEIKKYDSEKIEHTRSMISSFIEFDKYFGKNADSTEKDPFNRVFNNNLRPKSELKRSKIDFELLNDEEKAKLIALKDSRYSFSALEVYNSCKFKYFGEKILKLEKKIGDKYLLDFMEKGNLFHEILYHFYNEVAEKFKDKFETVELEINGQNTIKPLVNISLIDFDELKSILKDTTKKCLDTIKYELAIFELERLMLEGSLESGNGEGENIFVNFVESWLQREYARVQNTKFYPTLFEFSFGSSEDLYIHNNDEKIRIHGKIDRVEINKKEADTILFNVADYKSTLNPRKYSTNNIIEGRSLQIPIYVEAMNATTNHKNNFEVNSGVYYALYYVSKDKNGDSIEVLNRDKNPNIDEILDNSKAKLFEIVNGIADGDYEVEPYQIGGNLPCNFCDFKQVCRIKELNGKF